MFAPAKPMDASFLTSRAGTPSRKPIGSLVLMVGAGKRSNPAASFREKTVVLFLPSISPGCGFQSLPMARPLFARVTDPAKAEVLPLARPTTPHLKLQKPRRPSER